MKAVKGTLCLLVLLLCGAFVVQQAVVPFIIRRKTQNSMFFKWCQTISSTDVEGISLSDPFHHKLFPFPENLVLSEKEEKEVVEILNSISEEDLDLVSDPVRTSPVFEIYVMAGGSRYLFDCYDVTDPVFYLTPETPEEAEAFSAGPFKHLTVYAPRLLDFAVQRFSS